MNTSKQLCLTVVGAFFCCAAAVALAQRQEAPQAVSAYVAHLEADLTKALRVAELLELSRRELASVMRYCEPAARSWQLDCALAKEMGDQELFEFLVTRASSALAGGCEILSRHDLRNMNEKSIEDTKIRERYWEDTKSGHCHISADCVGLVEDDGQPFMIRKRAELKHYQQLQRGFKINRYRELIARQPWKTPLFRANMSYLKGEYGGFQEAPELAEAVRFGPAGKVYAVQLMNLRYYIQYSEGQQPKVIFVAPLTW